MSVEEIQRRRWTRALSEIRVKVSFQREHARQMVNGRSHDIGEGGIAVYVPVELRTGENVELEFLLPRSRAPYRVHATVRTRMGFRYGMEFLVLNKAQRDEIAAFVELKSAMGDTAQ